MTKDLITEKVLNIVDGWMLWRSDRKEWIDKKIYAEKYQNSYIGIVSMYIGNLKGKRILDCGCGLGGFSVAAARCGADVTGIELNSDFLEIAKLRAQKFNVTVNYIHGALEKNIDLLPKFDAVCLWQVLEHVEKPFKLLRDVKEVLKPNALVFLNAKNRFALKECHYQLYFLNWMPIPLAEAYIEFRGRSMEKNPYNNLEFSKMNYFTKSKFENGVHKVGLVPHYISQRKNKIAELVREDFYYTLQLQS